LKAKLEIASASKNLVVIIYLGGIRYLSGIPSRQSSFARIYPISNRVRNAKFIHWDMHDFHKTEADVLFITNFASPDFLRCLLSATPTTRSQHRLELLTFNSNDPKRFAESLSKFSSIRDSLGKSKPLGYSIGTVCRRFGQYRWPRRCNVRGVLVAYDSELKQLKVSKHFRAQVEAAVVRHDILAGRGEICLMPPLPIFGRQHVKLGTQDFARQAEQLVTRTTDLHTEMWKMHLDYQSDISGLGTVRTVSIGGIMNPALCYHPDTFLDLRGG
jgi:hypothetical protein